jgi:hypothetical protein
VPIVDGTHPVVEAGRFVDAPVDLPGGGMVANEVKTYLGWRTVAGTPQRGVVPLTDDLLQQIHKDVWARRHVPGYDPRWLFLEAPPSRELAAELVRNRIVTVTYR